MWRTQAVDRRAFILAALAAAGCATATPRVTPAASGLAELEPLYRADAGRDTLTLCVGSNGCTSKADFTFYVERRGGAVSLAFARRRVDGCRSSAMGRTELVFTWAELGLKPAGQVFLLNPVSARSGRGRTGLRNSGAVALAVIDTP